MRARAAALVASALLLGACGDDESASSRTTSAEQPALSLEIRHDDGKGRVTQGGLVCRGTTQGATGDLAGRPAQRLCREALRLRGFLVEPPPARRACTQLYGGPQTAQVSGTIDGRAIDRRFSRTDGCAIDDYERVKPILPIP